MNSNDKNLKAYFQKHPYLKKTVFASGVWAASVAFSLSVDAVPAYAADTDGTPATKATQDVGTPAEAPATTTGETGQSTTNTETAATTDSADSKDTATAETTDPADTTEPADSTETADPAETAETTESTETTETTGTAETDETAESADPTEAAETSDTSESTEPAQTGETADPAATEETEETQETITPPETTNPLEPAVPAKKTAAAELLQEEAVATFKLEDWTYEEYNDGYLLISYNGDDTDIVIPGEIDGKQIYIEDYRTSGTKLPYKMTSLTFQETNGYKVKVQVPSGYDTASMESYFIGYSSLESLDARGLDVSNVSNLEGMFSQYFSKNGNSLKTVNLSGWDTSKVTDMSRMFYKCSKLTTVDLSGWDTSSLTDMSEMFYQCENLTSLASMSSWTGDSPNLAKIASAFEGCASVTDFSGLDKLNVSKVTDLSRLFVGCTGLTDLSGVKSWKVSNVQCMDYLFSQTGITNVDNLVGWDTSNVISMRSVFAGCKDLQNINGLASWNTTNVSSSKYHSFGMQEMFNNCTSLSDISGLALWDVTNVMGMSSMFNNCTSLTNLAPLANWKMSNTTNISYMFADCSNLEDLSPLFAWDTQSVNKFNGLFANDTKITDLSPLANWTTSSADDMGSMFSGCSGLTNVNALSGWDLSKVTYMNSMFKGCTNLTDISGLSRPDGATFVLKKLDNMFTSCEKLTDVSVLSNWDVSNVTNIGGMFQNCTSLNAVPFSSWDVSNVLYSDYMFANCKSLTDLSSLSTWNLSKAINMSFMFAGCDKLEYVTALKDWCKDGGNVVKTLTNMFYNVPALKVIDLSGWKVKIKEDGKDASGYSKTWFTITSSMFGYNKTSKIFPTSVAVQPIAVIATDTNLISSMSSYWPFNGTRDTYSFFDGNGGVFTDSNNKTWPAWNARHYYIFSDLEKETVDTILENTLQNVPTPTKTGYTFVGWVADALETTDNNLENAYNRLMNSYTAQWTANHYTIKYNGFGGTTTDASSMADQSAVYDQTLTLRTNTFTREGYTFSGWGIKNKYGYLQKAYTDGQQVSNLTTDADGEVTLYAMWTSNKFTVTYDANGGTGSMDDQTISYNSGTRLTRNNFSKPGYHFVGWSTTPNGEAEIDNNSNGSKLATEEGAKVTLYAQWEANNYSVYFYGNGGSYYDADDEEYTDRIYQDAVYDQTFTLKKNLFSRPGYTFVGWSTSEDGNVEGATLYTDEQEVSNLTTNWGIQLFAMWVNDGSGSGSSSSDNRRPHIQAEDKTISAGQTFDPMTGVTATDKEDGDLTDKVTVDGQVDVTTPGTYKITYAVVDSNGQGVNKTITVTVQGDGATPSSEKPIIQVDDKTITAGEPFDPMDNVTVIDPQDGDITADVKVDGTVDPNTPGDYELTYTVTDADGHTTSKTITVTVQEETPQPVPEVPVIKVDDITINQGQPFNPLDHVTVTDPQDGDITANVTVDGTVDPNTPGTYELTYTVTDADGHTTVKTITVTVQAKGSQETPISEDEKENTSSDGTTIHADSNPVPTDLSAAGSASASDAASDPASTPSTGDPTGFGYGLMMLLSGLSAHKLRGRKRKKKKEN